MPRGRVPLGGIKQQQLASVVESIGCRTVKLRGRDNFFDTFWRGLERRAAVIGRQNDYTGINQSRLTRTRYFGMAPRAATHSRSLCPSDQSSMNRMRWAKVSAQGKGPIGWYQATAACFSCRIIWLQNSKVALLRY